MPKKSIFLIWMFNVFASTMVFADAVDKGSYFISADSNLSSITWKNNRKFESGTEIETESISRKLNLAFGFFPMRNFETSLNIGLGYFNADYTTSSYRFTLNPQLAVHVPLTQSLNGIIRGGFGLHLFSDGWVPTSFMESETTNYSLNSKMGIEYFLNARVALDAGLIIYYSKNNKDNPSISNFAYGSEVSLVIYFNQ